MMALPDATLLVRPVPAGGTTENVRGIQIDDPVDNSSAKISGVVLFPALQLKLGHQLSTAGGHVNKEFPDDGGGVLPTAPVSGTNLKLSATVLQSQQATLDPRGMLVMIVSGAAAGQVRRITGWTAGTQTVVVNRTWDGTAPAAGDK